MGLEGALFRSADHLGRRGGDGVRGDPLSFLPLSRALVSDAIECPFCGAGEGACAPAHAGPLSPEGLLLVVANNPWWRPEAGVCDDCAAGFERALAYVRTHGTGFARGGVPILPTPVRLSAPEGRNGRGVTIAFLDSGFFAHPDLVLPRDRILAYVDVNDPGARRPDLERPDVSSWHGMMTSVVACGNGWLSQGLYRGLASEASVVLVKVGSARRIRHDDIRRGLAWVTRKRKRYGIRIVNVSCGGDYEASYLEDGLSRAAEAATRAGLLVVAAAGNLGHRPGHPVLPPASAPSVLTVGGLDDKNRLPFSGYDMYHSSYGPTVDGLQKPEVIAARRGEDPRPQRHLRRLQARRRHELRRPDRLVARGAARGGQPRVLAPRAEAARPADRAAPAARRGGSPGLGGRRRAARLPGRWKPGDVKRGAWEGAPGAAWRMVPSLGGWGF